MPVRIIIDAMGGDNAPAEIVRGAVRAKRELVELGDDRARAQPAAIGEQALDPAGNDAQ